MKHLSPLVLLAFLSCCAEVLAASPAPEKSAAFPAVQKTLAESLLATGAAGLGKPDVQASLARHEFIRACGADALTELAKRDGGAAFLKAFLGDVAWIESFLTSDLPSISYAQAAENLRLLHRYGKGLDEPVFKRLATAVALSGGKMNAYRLVERFGQIQRACREGLLHASFDSLAVREMRWTLYLDGNAAAYQYLLDDRQTTLHAYTGAFNSIPYRLFNDYGDSIHQQWFHRPFLHAMTHFQTLRDVGGVCGSLSKYGAAVAKVHGVPAEPIGQPGHCAQMTRYGSEGARKYGVSNTVSWPNQVSAPGWEGTGYATLERLYEPVSCDVPRLLAANRAMWLARVQIDAKRPSAEWLATFDQAIAAQPVNFAVWLEYAKAVTADAAISTSARMDLARRAAKSLAAYPEAAWAMVQHFVGKSLADVSKDERMAFLLECHADVRQEKADRYVHWPLDGMLDWQASLLGKDPADVVPYFGKLLKIHDAEAPNQQLFMSVLGWGQARFAAKPQTSALFTKAMQDFFESKGPGGGGEMMRNLISEGLRTSARAGDLVTFRQWADMSAKLLPELKPEDVNLNPQQRAAFPVIQPFPGEVLSAKGLLKPSSSSKFDKPLAYAAVLRSDGFGGYFDTEGENTPSVIVELPGEGELSGMVIIDRYENPVEVEWSIPLKVSWSSDGKKWTEAATFTTAAPMYRVDLEGKNVRAKFVKLERLPGRKDRFHFRNILVYGKPLY